MKLNKRCLTYYANCDSPVDRQGYLRKKGEVHTSYQRRWFVLKGNLLFYFEAQGDREPLGVVVLEGCMVELCDAASTDYAFALRFEGAGSRTYTLAAGDQDELKAWVRALTTANHGYMRTLASELEQQYLLLVGLEGADPTLLEDQGPAVKLERTRKVNGPLKGRYSSVPWDADAANARPRASTEAPHPPATHTPRRSHTVKAPCSSNDTSSRPLQLPPSPSLLPSASCNNLRNGLLPIGSAAGGGEDADSSGPEAQPNFLQLHRQYGAAVCQLREQWKHSLASDARVGGPPPPTQ
ncbi:sesquipedalian-1 [Lampetra fluviatilis]